MTLFFLYLVVGQISFAMTKKIIQPHNNLYIDNCFFKNYNFFKYFNFFYHEEHEEHEELN